MISVVGATNKLDKKEEPVDGVVVVVSLVEVEAVKAADCLVCSLFNNKSPLGVVAVEDEIIFCTWTGVGPCAPVVVEEDEETRPMEVVIVVCDVFVDDKEVAELLVKGIWDILMVVIGVTGEAMVVLVLPGW